MWELYASLPEKPEWLTMEDIDRHESQMTGMEQEQPKKKNHFHCRQSTPAVSVLPLRPCTRKFPRYSATTSALQMTIWARAGPRQNSTTMQRPSKPCRKSSRKESWPLWRNRKPCPGMWAGAACPKRLTGDNPQWAKKFAGLKSLLSSRE